MEEVGSAEIGKRNSILSKKKPETIRSTFRSSCLTAGNKGRKILKEYWDDKTITSICDLNSWNTSTIQASTGSLFLSHSFSLFFFPLHLIHCFVSVHLPLTVYAFPFSWNSETANARVRHFTGTRSPKYVFKIIAQYLRQMSRCAMILNSLQKAIFARWLQYVLTFRL